MKYFNKKTGSYVVGFLVVAAIAWASSAVTLFDYNNSPISSSNSLSTSQWKNGVEKPAGTPVDPVITANRGTGQRHNRALSAVSATWPGNDTFSVTWTQDEDVRRYRVLVTGGADGDFCKIVEDATNEAQAEAWLATVASSQATDIEYLMVHTSTPDANGSFIPLWSEWQELTIDPDDNSLGRLDVLCSAVGGFAIFIEAE